MEAAPAEECPPKAETPRAPARASLIRKVLLSDDVDAVGASIAGRSAGFTARAHRATDARAQAELILHPVAQLDHGYDDVLALTALRQAAYWSILALDTDLPDGCSPEAAAASLSERLSTQLALSARESEVVARLVGGDFVTDTAMTSTERRAAIDALRGFVDGAGTHVRAPERALSRLLLLRWVRLCVIAVTVAAAGAGALWGIYLATRPPDLALAKPWKASSTYSGWDSAASTVDGAKSSIFFHTNQDASPWVQLDLGPDKSFSSVEIANRRECCAERASFLVVEVSTDATTWTEVATHSGDFSTWTARFPRQRARYVRVRSLKKTWLHFERVSVR